MSFLCDHVTCDHDVTLTLTLDLKIGNKQKIKENRKEKKNLEETQVQASHI